MKATAHMGFSVTALRHAKEPCNHGPLSRFNGHCRITGPCGDTMNFWLVVKDGEIRKANFTTDGCGSSKACGSMATCMVEGQPIERAASLQPEEILGALGGVPKAGEHCARLAADTLRAACEDYFRKVSMFEDGA